jgi:hypothetical protein
MSYKFHKKIFKFHEEVAKLSVKLYWHLRGSIKQELTIGGKEAASMGPLAKSAPQ